MADNLFDNIKLQFEQFLSLVGNVLSHEEQIHLIQNKLRRHFNTTLSSYLCSTDFQSSLIRIHQTFNGNNQSTKYFKLLNLFDDQLRKHSIKILNEPSKITTDSVNQSDTEMKQTRKIRRLERRLSNLSRIIRELEEKELSLDEMRYSDIYQVESKLKKQAYDIYIRIADLKHQSSSVERILDQPVILTDAEIDHPLINKALEDMVNQTRFLPCFNDVLNVVEKTDDRYELGLSADARKIIAEKAFKIIGMKVKHRRIADFNDIMNSRLPEDFDIEQNDPALDNVELENTLIENEREATIKTQKIFETYSQMDPDLQSEVDVRSSEESTAESDDDDEEEEEHTDDNQDESKSKPNANVDSPDDQTVRDYDVVDMLPPFSPCKSPSNTNEIIIPSEDPKLSPLSIDFTSLKRSASSSIRPTTRRPIPEILTAFNNDDNEESQPIFITPRRRTTTNDLPTTPEKRKKLIDVVILD